MFLYVQLNRINLFHNYLIKTFKTVTMNIITHHRGLEVKN